MLKRFKDNPDHFFRRLFAFTALGLVMAGAVSYMLTDSYLSVFAVSPPNIIPYQGRLLNANGVPDASASRDFQFRLYDSLAAGTCLWSNDDSSCASDADLAVTLTDGLFSENLGDTGAGYAAIPDSVFADDASVFLEVEVEGEVLSPRKQIGAAAYAFNADTLDGMDSASFALVDDAFVQDGNSFGATAVIGTNDTEDFAIETDGTTRMTVLSSGEVGIGTATPLDTVSILGTSGSTGIGIDDSTAGGNTYLILNHISASDSSEEILMNGDGTIGLNITNQNSGTLGTDLTDIPSSANFYTNSGNAGGLILASQHATAPMIFATGGIATGDERMRIDSAGNVGIGTTTPGETLEVSGTSYVSGHAAIGADAAVDDGSLLYPGSIFSNTLNVSERSTDASVDYVEGTTNYLLYDPSADASGIWAIALDSEAATEATNAEDVGTLSAGYFNATHNGTGDITSWMSGIEAYAFTTATGGSSVESIAGYFSLSLSDPRSSGTENNYGVWSAVSRTGATGGTINTYGVYVDDTGVGNAGAGTSTAYGLYLEDFPTADAQYSIYSEGGQSYHAGNFGIGATTPDADLDIEAAEDTERVRLTDTSNADSVGLYVGDGTAGLDGTLSAQAGSLFLDEDGKLWVNMDGATNWDQVATTAGGALDLDGAYDNDSDKKMAVDNASGLEFESSTAGNVFVDLQSTGDFVIQSVGTAFATFNDSGNVLFENSLTVGSSSADVVLFNADVDSHFIPDDDDTYDLGADAQRWRDLYLGAATLHVGSLIGDEGTISYDTGANALVVNEGGADTDFRIEGDTEANLLFLDAGNGRVGIGTASPTARVHATQSTDGGGGYVFENSNAGASAFSEVSVVSDGATGSWRSFGTGNTNLGFDSISLADSVAIGANTDATRMFVATFGTAPLLIGTNLNTSGTPPGIFIDTSNNVGIFDETPSAKLDVGGTFAVQGNSTLGNASGDTVTSNAAAWTFANDTTVALSGGVNGLNFDSNTLSIDAANNRIGIGTSTPSHLVDISAGTSTGFWPLHIAATVTDGFAGLRADITSSDTIGNNQLAGQFVLAAGATGAGYYTALDVENLAAGTGSDLKLDTSSNASLGNTGLSSLAIATTTGLNVGSYMEAANGATSVGGVGKSITAKASGTNIGVLGVGRNTSVTSPIEIGGYFGLFNSTPTFDASSGLIASNGSTTNNIFLARDNNTTVFSIVDGGSVGIGDATPDALLDVAGSFQFDGDATFGDAATDNVVFTADVNSNILPNTDDTYTLGDADQRWADIFLGPASIHIGTSATNEGVISYAAGTSLDFGTDSTTNADIAFFTDDLYLDKSTGRVGVGTAAPGYLLDVNGAIRAGTPGTDGQMRVYSEQGATDYEVVFDPNAAMTQNVTYTLPANDGDSGQFLTSDGAGALSWTTSAGSGDITAVGSMTSGDAFADSSADDDWLGLGVAAGRIEFDDLATDEVNVLGARVGVGTSAPDALVDVEGSVNGEVATYATNTNAGTAAFAAVSLVNDQGNSFRSSVYMTSSTYVGSGEGANALVLQNGVTTGPIRFMQGTTSRMLIDGSGDLSWSGNATFGDTSGDAITVNAATWTFANDTAVALSGGENGLNFDSNTLSIDATNDRVGIGTASPAAMFHATRSAPAAGAEAWAENTSATGYAAMLIVNDAGSGSRSGLQFAGSGYADTIVGNNDLALTQATANDLHFATSNTRRVTLDASGNLGIGDATPDYLLDVAGTLGVDGSVTLGDAVTDNLTVGAAIQGTSALVFDGSTDDANETTFSITNPTADNTITFQNGTGTVAFLSDIPASGDITAVGSMTSGDAFADATADDDWLGLGAAAGRIEFDDQATDEVNILSSLVGIGTSTPSAMLSVGASSQFQVDSSGNITTSGTLAVNGGIITATGSLDINSLTTTALTLDSGTTGDVNLGTGANAKAVFVGNSTGATNLTFNVGTGGINFGDNANTKTIDIGGVTSSGTDTINLATNGTAADVIAVGNSNASTTLALTGGNDWSISTAGLITTAGDVAVNGGDITSTGAITITPASGSNVDVGLASTGDFNVNVSGSPVFVVSETGVVVADSNIFVGNASSSNDDFLYFDGGTTESIRWDETGSEFEVSDDWNILGNCLETGVACDLAETFFADAGEALEAYDVVVSDASGTKKVKKSSMAYDSGLMGAVSLQPAILMEGSYVVVGNDDAVVDPERPAVVLSGVVRVKVSEENGVPAIGDMLATSTVAGHAMKASQPGMALGRMVGGYTAVSPGIATALVDVKVGWHSGGVIATDGTMATINDDVAFTATGTADGITQGFDSFGLSLRGSGWDGAAAQERAMKLVTDVTDASTYKLSIRNQSDAEVAYITDDGVMSVASDLVVGGKLYPSALGVAQTDKYVYYGGSGDDYMRTNASGWGTGSYDFAEMFPSSLPLEPGEVVAFDTVSEQVKRASGEDRARLAGIVSTKPGFVAGNVKAGDHPIALAGRVPTKVSLENGDIAVGDALTVSETQPGYAMKATEAGMIIGYALEPFDGSGSVDGSGQLAVGSGEAIIVFVHLGYWTDGSQPMAGTDNAASGSGTGSLSALNMTGNIYMQGNQILNVGAIAGLGGIWSVDGEGTFRTEATYKTVITSYQNEQVETIAVTSPDVQITLLGTAELVNGEATVSFESVNPSFNDVTSTTAPVRVLVTPNGPVSLYIVSKDHNGFTVRQVGPSTSSGSSTDSNVTFDWMVSAFRKDYEVVESLSGGVVEETAPAEETAPSTEPTVENPASTDTTATEPAPSEPVPESLPSEPVPESAPSEELPPADPAPAPEEPAPPAEEPPAPTEPAP